MRIAYTVRRSFPGPGGIATAMRVTAAQLARRHQVRVWASRIDAAPLTRLNATLGAQLFQPFWLDGVEVRPVPMGVGGMAVSLPMALMTVPGLRGPGYGVLRRTTAPAYVRAVGARLSADWERPDVVHAWGGEHLNWAAAHGAKRSRAPFVVTPFAHPKAWGDDDMNVSFYRAADRVCALLPAEAEFYVSLGVDRDRLRVVGVPVTPLPDGGPDVRARHGIGDAPIVLFFGVKERYKGYRTLLDAAPSVWAEHRDVRFAFVGPRTDASREDFAAVTDARVIEVGQVDDAEVLSWQRAATMLCLPSTSEILPVTILESWAQGVPVVACEWWCARDLIDDGRDGVIVEQDAEALGAAIHGLLANPAEARAMGAAGRAKVIERYTPGAVAARHEAVYAELSS